MEEGGALPETPAKTPTRGLETPTKSAAASPVSDTKHTVHRPTILRSASLLELKPHVAAQSDPVRVALMGQFRTRTVSTSRLDVDSSPETQAYTMPHDKVVEDLEVQVRGRGELNTVRTASKPRSEHEQNRLQKSLSRAPEDKIDTPLSRRELEGFRQAFSFLDKNHNGSISAKEVHTITKRFHGTKPELLELQARFDMSPYINNTGELVEEAFFAAVRDKRNADGLSMDESRRVFVLLDADGDGLISRNDMGKAFAAMGESTSDSEIKAMMRTFDTDKNGHLDEKEFNRLINSYSAPEGNTFDSESF